MRSTFLKGTLILQRWRQYERACKNQTANELVFISLKFTILFVYLFFNKGDYISVSNPEGNFKKSQVQTSEDLFLLAAGTGFTPMVKLLDFALTEVSCLRYVLFLWFNP